MRSRREATAQLASSVVQASPSRQRRQGLLPQPGSVVPLEPLGLMGSIRRAVSFGVLISPISLHDWKVFCMATSVLNGTPHTLPGVRGAGQPCQLGAAS